MQPAKLIFIDIDEAKIVGCNQPRHKLLDLALDALQLSRRFLCFVTRLVLARRPEQFQHGMGREQKLLRGFDGSQQGIKGSFQLFLADVLARLWALLVEAPIIGVAPVPALCPSGGHRLITAAAIHEAAQGKIFLHVRSR